MHINTSKSNILKTGISAVVAVILWAAFSFQSAVAGEEVSAEVKAKAQLTLAQWMKDRADPT